MGNFSLRRLLRSLLIPLLAVFLALVVGAAIMWLAGDDPIEAYKGLFMGAFGSKRGWATTIRKWSPLLLTGLSVAVAFQAGLFNIGASGQFMMGTIFSVWVGIHFPDLPALVHVPLAILAGILGGILWGAIPGILKVTTGAHEVISTIMLNYIAALFAGWTVYAGGSSGQKPGPLWDPAAKAISRTPPVVESARIPFIFGPPYRVHWGVVLVIVAIFLIAWLMYKTTIGFELRTVGQNFKASKYAGIRVGWTVVLAMMLAGALAGMAGAIETLGVNFKFAPEFGGSVGFDGITVALLGQTNPFGVGLAAFFMASLAAGGAKMQFDSGVSSDIIQVINALMLAFVAAPAIIRYVFRIRKSDADQESTPKISWGG
jgi:simple sugar transport system permease protein